MPPQHADSLKKPTDHCRGCGKPLEGLPKHPSRLAPGDEEAVERQDYCPECQAQARAGEYHSRWLAKRPAPPPPTKSQTRKAQSVRLREEFHRLLGQGDLSDEDQDRVYLLAHLLMKTGAFRWRETDDENGLILFEDTKTKEQHEIRDVPLNGERLAKAQESLIDLL